VKDSIRGNVSIIVHFGEDGNEYFVPATMVEPLCNYLKATLIDPNVACKWHCSKTDTHIRLARDHGFTFAPIDILDEGGTLVIPMDSGVRFKNVSMGMATPQGKILMHSNNFTVTDSTKCTRCGDCIKDCPANAILTIDKEKCIGCGKCITTYTNDAINAPDNGENAMTHF
jgi:uncharacterized protein